MKDKNESLKVSANPMIMWTTDDDKKDKLPSFKKKTKSAKSDSYGSEEAEDVVDLVSVSKSKVLL